MILFFYDFQKAFFFLFCVYVFASQLEIQYIYRKIYDISSFKFFFFHTGLSLGMALVPNPTKQSLVVVQMLSSVTDPPIAKLCCQKKRQQFSMESFFFFVKGGEVIGVILFFIIFFLLKDK